MPIYWSHLIAMMMMMMMIVIKLFALYAWWVHRTGINRGFEEQTIQT